MNGNKRTIKISSKQSNSVKSNLPHTINMPPKIIIEKDHNIEFNSQIIEPVSTTTKISLGPIVSQNKLHDYNLNKVNQVPIILSNILLPSLDNLVSKQSHILLETIPINVTQKSQNRFCQVPNICLPQNLTSFPNKSKNEYKEDTLSKENQDQSDLKILKSQLVEEQNVTTKLRCNQKKIKNYVHISDVKAPPRAIAVLPKALLLRRNNVITRRNLNAHARFGPVQGIRNIISRAQAKNLLLNSSTPVFLLNLDEDNVIHIDVSDYDKSNWFALLPLGTATTANIWLYEEDNELYALGTHPISQRKLIAIGYSTKYAQDQQMPEGPPTKDIETVYPVQWWCNECHKCLSSSTLLQRHIDIYHKGDVRKAGRSNRCRYCRRTFARLYSLKRHIQMYCLKTPKPRESPQKCSETISEAVIEPINKEDNRIPSDESFQTFTHSIDFSTSLFDTDRISSLDISGHSRSGSELNSYSHPMKDDNGFSIDLGFTRLSNFPDSSQTTNESVQETTETLLDTCIYCNNVVVKENIGEHLSECSSRLSCGCGRVFRHKKSLAHHIHKFHRDSLPEKKIVATQPPDDDDKSYKCDECSMYFKRRGMLVNHLWRVHKTVSTTKVEKKVRHYPCVACPKIYKSAAKRDRHIKIHHPDAGNIRGLSIEGGVRSCEPAACAECPRQYATRAKLYQHVRAQHPHLASAIKKQIIKP